MTQAKLNTEYVRWLDSLNDDDVALVGGKNASLGEMIQELKSAGIPVPNGFATTADAYRHFVEHNNLADRIREQVGRLDGSRKTLRDVGNRIREMIEEGEMPDDLAAAIREAYGKLSERNDEPNVDVAVRSSATAEDLPEASFAGQLETFLNISGEDAVLQSVRKCYASLFTDRAISYREEQGFDHMKIALSAGVQKMVRAGAPGGAAGVMFTIDTETGFPNVVVINGAWGLGETVVSGEVNPDEYRVFKPLLDDSHRPIIKKSVAAKEVKLVYTQDGKDIERVEPSDEEKMAPCLTDENVLNLGRWAKTIEDHYERPMDVEWAKDGDTGELYVLQARPETVQSQKAAQKLHTYRLKEEGKKLVEGLAVGSRIAAGKAFVLESPEEAKRFEDGGVLVTTMTNPDWGPILKRASGIITDSGGRTSHAAIVSRELGVPAVVGSENATSTLKDGQEVTINCAIGETGYVYEGKLDYDEEEIDTSDLPKTKTQIMMILASPDAAFNWWNLPTKGVGLARMEFIINNAIKIHPLALTRFDQVQEEDRRQIESLTRGYEDKTEYFVEKLARGIGSIASPSYPNQVIVRMSDFKTNEYADLIGGSAFEPKEANPMLGFRGASRYYSDRYKDGFALECRAIGRVREEMGFSNVIVMVPFCRTIEEADRVLEAMAEHGLKRGENDLKVYMMAEIPSNIEQAREFAERFDGFSIGTNDLTQLVLGVDRDSEELSHLYDERNPAVKQMIARLIKSAHEKNTVVGICGQAPSDHPDFGEFLVQNQIDTISVNPDSVIDIIRHVAKAEGNG